MKKSLCITSLLLLTLTAWSADLKPTTAQPAIKKSTTGICHSSQSPHHAKLKKFTPYDSLKACLDSGGKQPVKKMKA